MMMTSTTVEFRNAVTNLTDQMKRQLSELGASGSTLSDQVANVQHLLGVYELVQLSSIAKISKSLAYENGYDFRGNRRLLFEACEWLISRLDARIKARAQSREKGLLGRVLRKYADLTVDCSRAKSSV